MDLGLIIGFIGVVCGAGMIGMSHFGAYLLGRSRARAELESELRSRDLDRLSDSATDRMIVVESAIAAMAQSIERLSEVERAAMMQRLQNAEPRPARSGGAVKNNTPA